MNTLSKALSVPGFTEFYERLVQHMAISGKSQSMLTNYGRHLARIALRFGCVPTEVDVAQIRQYLFEIKRDFPSASETYFKFTVFSLRYAYKMEGMTHKTVAMPSIQHPKKLPVVLSKQEMRRLIETPKWLKHKLLIGLLYGCGLRCMEVRNIRLTDLDFDRKMLLVRQGKGKRDRYVPLAKTLIRQLQDYISRTRPSDYLFHGKPNGRAGGVFDSRYSHRGIQWVVRQIALRAQIHKPVSVHTLRHTFAIHLLEDGLDIVSIKELLGHSRIETTMIYLHVVQLENRRTFSPLDTLYGPRYVSGDGVLEHPANCPAIKILNRFVPDQYINSENPSGNCINANY